MTAPTEVEFGSYPDPTLDPNPCEAWVYPLDAEPHTCGTFVDYSVPLLFGQVICPEHTEVTPPQMYEDMDPDFEPTFDDYLARRVDAEMEASIPWCDFCGGEGHTAVAHDR